MEIKGFISIYYHHKCLIQLFLIHLNTYVMGLRPLEILYSYSAGIDFSDRRQILTTKVYPRAVSAGIDFSHRRQILTTKVYPRAVRVSCSEQYIF